MKRHLFGWGGDKSAAVAPTVALSLFALVGAGGIAFDYSRMASLDTELQNAADQSALAGATQLDEEAGAIARATAAAQGLLTNETRFANDGGGAGITVPEVYFYETRDDAENETNPINPADEDADERANFIRVVVDAREVDFALTPVVGAFSSGELDAEAVAGLGSSICKVPPLMMCNPQEGEDPDDPLGFEVSDYIGDGLRLVQSGGGAWVPGNYGYLQTGLQPGSSALEYALGANGPPGDCLAADGVTTKPGVNTSVTDAINTRFDIYENGLTNDCNGSTCSPSPNVSKDVVRPVGSTNWGFQTGNDPWVLPSVRYLPDSSGTQASPYPTAMGHPRDKCHAVSLAGNCAGDKMGDGDWDRQLYFWVNHRDLFGSPAAPNSDWTGISSLTQFATEQGITLSEITRYETYLWEIESENLPSRMAYSGPKLNAQGNPTGQIVDYWSHLAPQSAGGLPAGPTQLDRRLTAVAVVNCIQQGLNGQEKDVPVAKWVEVFFVEPSLARDRTSASDVYVEIVRETTAGGNAPTNPQVVRRDVPYLVK